MYNENTGKVTVLQAGDVTVKATKSGGANYYDIVALISFTVGKANPDYKIPENLTAFYGALSQA